MRLSDVLSRKPTKEYIQVDGFLQNKKGIAGQSVGITVGKVALNYFCKNCDDLRTFSSKNKIDVLFVDDLRYIFFFHGVDNPAGYVHVVSGNRD